MKKKINNIDRLINIMYLLREKCPWDQKQTLQSLISLTIEEVYELQQLILADNRKEIKNELGDILVHILFFSLISEEDNNFNFYDVVDLVIDKLIYRHPHVFGNTNCKDEKEVKRNWEILKLHKGKKSILEGVPSSLPSLIRSFRIQEKVSNVGFDFKKKIDVIKKIKEEVKELEETIIENKKEDMNVEFGDLLFSLVNYARHLKIDPENALQASNNKFISRFKNLEIDLDKNKESFDSLTEEELNVYWEKQKIKK